MPATDNPTSTLTLVHGGRKRTIRDYHGNECMPPVLRELEAEVDRKRDVLVIAAVHEFLPFDREEDEMVRREIADLAEWLGVALEPL